MIAPKGLAVLGVAIVQQITTVSQSAASLHGHVSGHLLHPPLVRVNGNAGDIHPAALEMDEKQHVVGHQPAQRQHLGGEEIGPGQQLQVDSNEGRPCGRALRSGTGDRRWRCRTLPIV